MWKSTLVLAALFAATLYAETQALQARALPFAAVVAGLLALATTLALGSLQGIWQAMTRSASPETPPSQWLDGALVRVGGRLNGAALKRAPWSGREVLFYWYDATARPDAGQAGASAPRFRGIDAAPMELVTGARTIRLVGVPNPRQLLPETQFQDGEKNDEAARHLASTSWQTAPETGDFSLADAELNVVAVPLHLINRSARLQLDAVEGRHYASAHFLERLRLGRWTYRERVLLPGEDVTVTGTFRDHPPRIDIGAGRPGAGHAISRGLPAATASSNLVSTIVFAVVLALVAAAAHYFVYGQQSTWYLELVGRLGSG